ncbi:UNVERIFIED_CONTAM: hypothetical protein Slati_0838800 [Sesamum latifolium]|uniref:RNase H type-1 domain-containing protein n=1 Tax=Sesamum latifolium TaxID=2727402 RepID=A0AAW2XQF9_9LAMI
MATDEMAEAWAAREAIQLAIRSEWSSVIIEGDCLVLISKLRGPERHLSPVGSVISDIHNLANSLVDFSFSCVKRIGNSAAHSLAKLVFASSSEESVLPRATLDIVNHEITKSPEKKLIHLGSKRKG